MKRSQVPQIARFLLLIWAIYFAATQFAINIILELQGVSPAFTGFYWVIHGGLLALAILIAWKPHLLVTQVAGIFYTLASALFLSRYVTDQFWVLMPGVYVFHWVLGGILLLNFLLFVGQFFKGIRHWRERVHRDYPFWTRKKVLVAGISLIIALGGLWSLFGFTQDISITDPGINKGIRVSFYNAPIGADSSEYNTTEARELWAQFQQLNATFYLGVTYTSITNPYYRSNFTEICKIFAEFQIQVVTDIVPRNSTLNGIDFVTYQPHMLGEMNRTIDAVTDWVVAESVSNFRGISFDVEGPIYGDGYELSAADYAAAVQSYTNKLVEFKQNASLPGHLTHVIGMDGIIFDGLDGDHDLDVMSKTVTMELPWDYFGFMTYMVEPGYSNYRFWTYCQIGKQQWGSKMVPWIGWLDPNTYLETEPLAYQNILEQVKIAKSLGLEEVVIAPSRNFISAANHSLSLQRLQALVDIKTQTFAPFDIPITQNLKLVFNFTEYLSHVSPYSFMASENIFRDLIVEPTFVVEIALIAIVIPGLWTLRKRGLTNHVVPPKLEQNGHER